MGNREEHLAGWVKAVLAEVHGAPEITVQRISGDASFRGYYRVRAGARTWVAVDAPPGKEDSRPFIEISRLLAANGLHVPVVHRFDLEAGFMLVSDLGDDVYLPKLADPAAASYLYGEAIRALVRLQSIEPAPGTVPPYDRGRLMNEMDLFPEWFLTRQLGFRLSEREQRLLGEVFECLVANALEQPQVLVHRDYHSRNLMVCGEDTPGIVDFQDAVIGPQSYDLVSLLRDCYIEWPVERVREWIGDYLAASAQAGRAVPVSEERFVRWFDLMGLQRHIKVAGIFCRLHLRDGKEIYLHDIPLVMKYVLGVTARYAEFEPFHAWLCERVLPGMAEHAHIFGPLRERLGAYL